MTGCRIVVESWADDPRYDKKHQARCNKPVAMEVTVRQGRSRVLFGVCGGHGKKHYPMEYEAITEDGYEREIDGTSWRELR